MCEELARSNHKRGCFTVVVTGIRLATRLAMRRAKVLWWSGLALTGGLLASGCLGEDEPDVCRSGYPQFITDLSNAGDVTPPSATIVESIKASVYDEAAEASCEPPFADFCLGAELTVSFRATDDLTPADQLGFDVQILAGQPPEGFELGLMPVKGSTAMFTYALPARAFSLDMEVRAIDLNGNLGPPTLFTVSKSAQGERPREPLASKLWLGLVALAGVLGSKRRSVRR